MKRYVNATYGDDLRERLCLFGGKPVREKRPPQRLNAIRRHAVKETNLGVLFSCPLDEGRITLLRCHRQSRVFSVETSDALFDLIEPFDNLLHAYKGRNSRPGPPVSATDPACVSANSLGLDNAASTEPMPGLCRRTGWHFAI